MTQQISIQILNVTPVQATTKTGKPYTIAEVAYKNLTFNKVESKKLMPFGATASASAALLKAASGTKWDVSVVKNEAGYNDWTAVTESNGDSVPAQQSYAPAPGRTGSANATTPRSTYETPEERAKKQIYIIRQSSISSAVGLLSVGSKAAPKIADVIDIARQLENYVLGIEEAGSINEPSVFDMQDDVPL